MADDNARTLPEGFLEFLHLTPALDGLADALAGPPAVAVRVNRSKGIVVPAGVQRVPWCDAGFYLDSRPRFTFDPALHQGLYYVQDPSSMVILPVAEHIVSALGDMPLRWLDACSAPGGKTTAIADALPEGSLLVANEYDRARAAALVENVERRGDPAIVVTNNDTADIATLAEAFDVISVDAPCSGEGMMRKEEAAVAQWSPGLIEQCAALQREILANVWQALRPGGYLVYSTCTFNRRENEENIDYLVNTLGAESIAFPVSRLEIAPGIDTPHSCARFIPGRVEGEGLFMAVVRKPGDEPTRPLAGKSRKNKGKTAKANGAVSDVAAWLKGDFDIVESDGEVVARPAALAADIDALRSRLRMLHAGIPAATLRGRELAPTLALARSIALNAEAFPQAEIDYGQAIDYLVGSPITLPADTPRCRILLTYDGHPLGFVKNLGSRANNPIPATRRIHSPHRLDTPPAILHP